jgi:hypothetical protein
VPLSACGELTQLSHIIAKRIARYLERQGLLVRDADDSYLAAHAMDSADDGQMPVFCPRSCFESHFVKHEVTFPSQRLCR